jgi:hypothetical protein
VDITNTHVSATVIILPDGFPEPVATDLVEHQVAVERRAPGQFRVSSSYAEIAPFDAIMRLRDTLNELLCTRGGLSFAIFNIKAVER